MISFQDHPIESVKEVIQRLRPAALMRVIGMVPVTGFVAWNHLTLQLSTDPGINRNNPSGCMAGPTMGPKLDFNEVAPWGTA